MNRSDKIAAVRNGECGAALVLTMILLAVLSVMTVSMMFLSQTETYATNSYRLMSQARAAADAGLNKAGDFLTNSYTPPLPADLANYNRNVSPVTYNNTPIVLSALAGVPAVVTPDMSADQTAFNTPDTGARGTLMAGTTRTSYATAAQLVNMRVEPPSLYNPNGAVLHKWRVTSQGSIDNVQNALVEVSAMIDQIATSGPVFDYAAFATAGCGDPNNNNDQPLNFQSNNARTDSYDSSNSSQVSCLRLGTCTADPYGGHIGTNGFFDGSNGVIINGSLSTPRLGVSRTCAQGGAWDGQGTINGSPQLIELAEEIDYPTPPAPVPTPITTNQTTNQTNNSCNSIPGCSIISDPANEYRLARTCAAHPCDPNAVPAPVTYGNLSIGSSSSVLLCPGVYNVNSIQVSSGSQVRIGTAAQCGGATGPVILMVAGRNLGGSNPTAISFSGNSISNPSLNPAMFQIFYAGTARVDLAGGGTAAATIYAPNAEVRFTGGGAFYGAVIGYTVANGGGAQIHYDRNLSNTIRVVRPGNYLMHTFTWRRF